MADEKFPTPTNAPRPVGTPTVAAVGTTSATSTSDQSAAKPVAAPPVHPSFPIRTSALNAASEHLATLDINASREDIINALDSVSQLTAHEKAKIIRQIGSMPASYGRDAIRSGLTT